MINPGLMNQTLLEVRIRAIKHEIALIVDAWTNADQPTKDCLWARHGALVEILDTIG